jgi:Gram-negative bacterial TonB protein C-terminal
MRTTIGHQRTMKLSFYVLFVLLTLSSVCLPQNDNKISPPKILTIPFPDYPQTARDAGVGGAVYVVVLINKKGSSKVVDWYGPMAPCSNLDDPLTGLVQSAAVEAAKKATFTPAAYKGKSVEKGFLLKYIFDPQKGLNAATNDDLASTLNDPRVNWPVTIKIPKAHYPSSWRQTGGTVSVKLVIHEDGLVHYAGAVSGHRDLRRAAVEAACKATFKPATLDGQPVKFEYLIDNIFYYYFEQ